MPELCLLCRVPEARVLELVDEGIVEPRGHEPARWRFQGISVRRIHRALRLERDLGVNLAGVDVIMRMSERMAEMDKQMRRLESEIKRLTEAGL